MKKIFTSLSISLLAGCVSVPVKSIAPAETIKRSPVKNERWQVEIQSRPDFEEEKKYVAKRRERVRLPKEGPQLGLAFSGGGLRSATINLGVLQGLQEDGVLRKVDYLSCVSGGAYIGAWYAAHLTNGDTIDSVGQTEGSAEYTSDADRLLGTDKFEGRSESIKGLEEGRGFVYGINYANIPKIFGFMAATIPVNLVMDVGLHFKPTRGKFNWHHPNFLYQHFIERTYLSEPSSLLLTQNPSGDFHGGKPHSLALEEINPDGNAAPYLIVNCALANSRPDAKFGSNETLPFEFSRFSCGSMPLGFVPAKDFGFPVEGTYRIGKKRYAVMRTNPLENTPLVKPFKLSSAVAASGAAVDASALGNQIAKQERQQGAEINAPIVTTKRKLWDVVLKPLNLNLRHQNRNFAMAITQLGKNENQEEIHAPLDWEIPKHDLQDRAREVTTDRFHNSVFCDSLYLSDGAHYENLGIFALTLRPEIKEIWSIDAGADPDYKFKDIIHVEKLLCYSGWKVIWQNETTDEITGIDKPFKEEKPCIFREGDKSSAGTRLWNKSPIFKAKLYHKGSHRSIDLYYVKSSYRENDGADEDSKRFMNKYYCGGTNFGARAHSNFPHTSTANLAFSSKDFRAYREIGRALGHKLAEAATH